MNLSPDQLKKKYDAMTSAELEELAASGSLSEDARIVLDQVMQARGETITRPPTSFSHSAAASASIKRYSDAYFVSRAITGAGSLIKWLGVVLGILIAVGGTVLVNASSAGTGGLLSVVLFGFLAGLFLYFIGILVAAQGQILKAALDAAVHTSPFLDDKARSEAMSLV